MTIFLIALSFTCIFAPVTSNNLRSTQAKNVIVDNSQSNLQLAQVVRRNPTITVVENQTPVKPVESNTISFGNSNTNNGGVSVLGKTATIVGKNILFFTFF